MQDQLSDYSVVGFFTTVRVGYGFFIGISGFRMSPRDLFFSCLLLIIFFRKPFGMRAGIREVFCEIVWTNFAVLTCTARISAGRRAVGDVYPLFR